MKLLGIDIGSSSVKAGILTGPDAPSSVSKADFETTYEIGRAEVEVDGIARALRAALQALGRKVQSVDAIAITTMAPSWLAMDKRGRAITPVVTHQDRRAIEQAHWIEDKVGRDRHLQITGNRPFPGGISSTTWRWFNTHEKSAMRRADLVGHLSTWFIRNACGTRVTDPSNAAFMGVYESLTLQGWSYELIDTLGVKRSLLPEVREANVIAGHVTSEGARLLGLPEGVPVLTGCMDGSAAMMAAGEKVGQMTNVSGSTDVLALLVRQPRPHPALLTRPLGVGKRWLAVSTLAAAGSALDWAWRVLYADIDQDDFYRRVPEVLNRRTLVQFDPHLAGSRVEVDERTGSITHLRLSDSRDDILAALCHALSRDSAERIDVLKKQYGRILRTVAMTGGVQKGLSELLHREWARYGKWDFRPIEHATLRGLWRLV